MSGSHSLQPFVNEVARDVPDPRGSGTSVLEARRARLVEQAPTDAERAAISARPRSRSTRWIRLRLHGVSRLPARSRRWTSGSAATAAAASTTRSTTRTTGSRTSPTRTSRTRRALSRTIGTALLRLADADVLPFEFTRHRGRAARIRRRDREDAGRRQEAGPGADPHGSRTLHRRRRLREGAPASSHTWMRRHARAHARRALGELNRDRCLPTERRSGTSRGLPRRDWFKHLAYAPGFYTGYGVKTLPGIREGIEQEQWDEARSFIPIVAAAIDQAGRSSGEGGRAGTVALKNCDFPRCRRPFRSPTRPMHRCAAAAPRGRSRAVPAWCWSLRVSPARRE